MRADKPQFRTYRWSGEVKVRCHLTCDDHWLIRVLTRDGTREYTIDTDNWLANTGRAVDCSEAWDQAARTAINFALDDDWVDRDNSIYVSDHAAYNSTGEVHVGRTFAQAYPRDDG